MARLPQLRLVPVLLQLLERLLRLLRQVQDRRGLAHDELQVHADLSRGIDGADTGGVVGGVACGGERFRSDEESIFAARWRAAALLRRFSRLGERGDEVVSLNQEPRLAAEPVHLPEGLPEVLKPPLGGLEELGAVQKVGNLGGEGGAELGVGGLLGLGVGGAAGWGGWVG